ncbi:hypothetical protein BDZ89DRAFT_1109784 [Hymenopellis radicata]|nr:hypothetical protein BDZ89DRAFT_1109784 [Hymenopellis radicata]
MAGSTSTSLSAEGLVQGQYVGRFQVSCDAFSRWDGDTLRVIPQWAEVVCRRSLVFNSFPPWWTVTTPDVDLGALASLEGVQKACLRRIMGLGSQSIRSVLFTETVLQPLKYRRVILTLQYLCYLLSLPLSQFAARALHVSDTLRLYHHSFWLIDLDIALRGVLPTHNILPAELEVAHASKTSLRELTEMTIRLYLLHGCAEPFVDAPSKPVISTLRHYLTEEKESTGDSFSAQQGASLHASLSTMSSVPGDCGAYCSAVRGLSRVNHCESAILDRGSPSHARAGAG